MNTKVRMAMFKFYGIELSEPKKKSSAVAPTSASEVSGVSEGVDDNGEQQFAA